MASERKREVTVNKNMAKRGEGEKMSIKSTRNTRITGIPKYNVYPKHT